MVMRGPPSPNTNTNINTSTNRLRHVRRARSRRHPVGSVLAMILHLFGCGIVGADHSTWVAASTAASSSAYTTCTASLSAMDTLEESRFGRLPPTVFAPSGRLHMVERAARAASHVTDRSGCLAVALRCCSTNQHRDSNATAAAAAAAGVGKQVKKEQPVSNDSRGFDNDGGFIVMVCTRPVSPHGHDYSTMISQTLCNNGGSSVSASPSPSHSLNFSAPLFIEEEHEQQQQHTSSAPHVPPSALPPLTIFSSSLLAVTGGNAIDSAILLHRIKEIAISLQRASGAAAATAGAGARLLISASGIARRLADTAQLATQHSSGTRAGRILSSSALIIGADVNIHSRQRNVNNNNNNNNASRNNVPNLWRIDPTGQFWKCDATAIGRGAGIADLYLMERVSHWKKNKKNTIDAMARSRRNNNNDEIVQLVGRHQHKEKADPDDNVDDVTCHLSNTDVKQFLNSLTVMDALKLATNCIHRSLEHKEGNSASSLYSNSFALSNRNCKTRGALQAVILEVRSKQGKNYPKMTVLNERNLRQCLEEV